VAVVEPIEGLRAEWDANKWRLVGDPGPEAVELIRMITVRLDDGRTLGLLAARPAGATGHDEEAVRALLDGGDDAPDVEEALLSTEYDADGLIARAGIELLASGADYPMRLTGDRTAPPEGTAAEQVCAMSFRLDGVVGRGTYELRDRRAAG
jgi:hypothetical protein